MVVGGFRSFHVLVTTKLTQQKGVAYLYFDTKMLYYCHKNYPVKLAYYT